MNFLKLPLFQLASDQTNGHARFRISLNIKLLLLIIAVLLIGVFTSSILVLNLQRQQLIESSETAAQHANNAVRASLEHAMLNSDLPMANVIAASVVSPNGIELVQVINTQGVIRISSDVSEIGRHYDRNQKGCRSCHLNEEEATRTATLYKSNTDTEVLLTVNPIYNQPQCMECHSSQTQVLGLLMTETSLATLDDTLAASEGRIILAAVFTFILMTILFLLALRRFVIRPISELVKGMAEIGGGNLNHRVPVIGNDELGDLAAAFDSMRQHLCNSQAATIQSNRELSVLYEVALATGHIADLEQILRSVLKIIVEKMQMQTGLIYLWNESQRRFERVSSRGLSSEQLQEIDRRRMREGGDLTREIADLGNTHYVPDMSTSHHFQGLFENLSQRAYINVPLKSQGKVVGTLELSTLPGHKLTEREIDVVKAVGYEIGIAIENTSLLAETRRNEKEATTLYEMGTQISASLELDQVLNTIADAARQVLAADIGVIGLADAEQQCISVKAFAGTQSQSLSTLCVPYRTDVTGLLNSNQPVIVEQFDSNMRTDDSLAEFIKAEGIVSFLAVPLWRGGLRGLVGIMTRHARHFSTGEIHLLTRLAQQTTVTIENAQLYERVQFVTVLEERERIAREIHDGLAQLVGSMRVWAEEAEMSLEERDWKASRRAIKKVEEAAHDAYTSLREEMMGLRKTFVPSKDIFPVVAEYLSRFQREWGIETYLQVHRADNGNGSLSLTPNIEIQLLRIIQEGLTNVRRHANARHILVDCNETPERLSIAIQDDGTGFVPGNIPEGHFGLRIMSERAASFGGQIQVHSELGHGTKLEIILPRSGQGVNHDSLITGR